MCHDSITTYQCNHKDRDVFPCDASLQHPEGVCPNPKEPEKIDKDGELCTRCAIDKAEDDEMAEALRRIAEDESLRPVEASDKRGKLAKTREYYPHCGHYASVVLQDFEVGADEPEYIDMEMPGSCWGCAGANPRMIEEMKQTGKWNDDPWGEMSKKPLTDPEHSDLMMGANAGGSSMAPVRDPVFTRDWNGRAEDDLQAPMPTRLPGGQPAFDESDEEELETSRGKGKGVRGRPVPSRSAVNDESDEDEDEQPHHEGEPASEPESEGPVYESEDEHPPRRGRHAPEPAGHRNQASESDDEDEQAPPDWSASSHPMEPSPAAHSNGDDPKALAAISDDERKRLGIGNLALTNEAYQSILRRKNAEADQAMNAHRSGALPD